MTTALNAPLTVAELAAAVAGPVWQPGEPDHVRRFTIVTADGEIRDVTPAGEPDLYWAVLGGKGNFGIVTDIEFELMPVPRFYGGGIFFPASATADVLHAWREWAPTLPEDASTSVALLRLPPDPALPEPLRGQFVTHVRFTYLGDTEAGAALLTPMRAVAEPLLDLVDELPYAAVDAVHMDPTDPMPIWDRGTGLAELPAAAVDAVLAAAGPAADVPLTMVEIRLLGGAIGRQPAVPNAVTGRDAAFSLFILGVLAGQPVEVVAAATAAVVEAVLPWQRGGVLNLLGQAGPRRIGELWNDAERTRLLRTRAYYDPAGLFASNIVIG